MHRIVISLAILLLSAPAFAQAPPPPPPPGGGYAGPAQPDRGLIAKGVKAGFNIANVAGDDAGDVDSRTGLGVGAFIVYGLGGNLGMQIEALYMQQGATGSSDGVDFTIAYDYLQVPALARLSIPTGGQMTPYVVGGAAFSVLVVAEARGNGQTIDIKDDAASVDVAIVGGAGVEVPAGSGAFVAELRYARGLVTLDPDGDFSVYNSVLSLFAGYSF